MVDFALSRRSFLATTSMLLASTAMPSLAFAQEAKAGGRLVVAADSEPKNLNPAIVASNGVFFISSKVVEPLAEASFDGEGGLDGRLAAPEVGTVKRANAGNVHGRDPVRKMFRT